MIGPVFFISALAAVNIQFAPNAVSSTLATGPSCMPGWYVNPDDLGGPCLPATPGNAYVSLAGSPTAGPGGWGTGSSQVEAERVALAQCVSGTNTVCEIIASTYDGCAAYAFDPASRISTGGIGPDVATASADAINKSPNGQILMAECSRP
jgi:hypothetical protein